ncbi:MAG: TetR/AcrR family transcriptional regulator [Ktedonobacterales bacterium]
MLTRARRLFMQRGFASVSVGEVAQAAGVTKPTLYYHFGDKEGLYAAVLCDVLREIGGYLRLVTEAPGSVRDRLYELALGYFRHADATMEPMLRDTTELIGPDRAEQVWRTYESDCLSPLRTFLLDGMRTGEIRAADTDHLVRAFFALLDGFTAPGGHTARADEQHQRMAALLTELFLDGAAPREVLSS